MPPSTHSDLPADPAELARIVADNSQPGDRVNTAMELLLPTISLVAQKVVNRPVFSERLHRDLSDEAGDIIWQKLGQFDPAQGRFECWCYTVLYRKFLDQSKKLRSGLVQPAVGEDDSSILSATAENVDSREELEDLLQRCRELRAALNRVAWPPRRNVHHFAVLLLHLRFVMAGRWKTYGEVGDESRRRELPELIEWLLPWNHQESQACLKPGWPRLAELWSATKQEIRQSVSRIDIPTMCSTIQSLLPPSVCLTTDVWNQWAQRAKREARKRLGDEGLWERCFSGLLPDSLRT